MIDFRYHLVSIVAIFMALAIGIVLGTGPLREPIRDNLKANTETLRKSNDDLRGQIRELQGQVDYDQKFVSTVLPALVAGRLAGSSVLVVAAPGVSDSMVTDLADTVAAAGGTVTGTLTLRPEFLRSDKAADLERVAEQSKPTGMTLAANASPAGKAAAVLATALVTKTPGEPPPSITQAALTAFEDLGVVKASKDLTQQATLTLLVAPKAPDADQQTAARDSEVLLTVARQFDTACLGAVVAATAADTTNAGLVGVLRGSALADQVSSVDNADTVTGRATTVFALVERGRGGAGQYGSGPGAGRPVPDLAGSTSP